MTFFVHTRRVAGETWSNHPIVSLNQISRRSWLIIVYAPRHIRLWRLLLFLSELVFVAEVVVVVVVVVAVAVAVVVMPLMSSLMCEGYERRGSWNMKRVSAARPLVMALCVCATVRPSRHELARSKTALWYIVACASRRKWQKAALIKL